jgi:hypothetical protein
MVPKGPYKLCTVNTAPERAKRLIGRLVEDVKEEYTILYLANAESEFVFEFSLGLIECCKPTQARPSFPSPPI